MSDATTRKRAFTLIEVLVVVAIIALLIAILLPSLARARSQARSSVCLSNLHQMGLSMNMYTSEFKDVLPRGSSSETFNWVYMIARNFDRRKYKSVNDLPIDKMAIFHCPERQNTSRIPFLDYVVNAMDPRGPQGGSWIPMDNGNFSVDPSAFRISYYKRASEVIYLIDAEREDVNIEGHTFPALKTASVVWEDFFYRRVGNGLGAFDTNDAFIGAHMPQGRTNFNVGDVRGPANLPYRRVARKLHLGRFSNAVFLDGHAASVSAVTRANDIENYAYWLRLFGVKNPLQVAQADTDGR